MNLHERRVCPECLQGWPRRDLRVSLAGFGWLEGLPRNISPDNVDCVVHDGAEKRNRFLALETKNPEEPWPLQTGQEWMLAALANQPRWTVRVLRGIADAVDVHRVTSSGVDYRHAVRTTSQHFRDAVMTWLQGAPWRDPIAEDGPVVHSSKGYPLPYPGSKGQNADGTWGELGWYTEALYQEWG